MFPRPKSFLAKESVGEEHFLNHAYGLRHRTEIQLTPQTPCYQYRRLLELSCCWLDFSLLRRFDLVRGSTDWLGGSRYAKRSLYVLNWNRRKGSPGSYRSGLHHILRINPFL